MRAAYRISYMRRTRTLSPATRAARGAECPVRGPAADRARCRPTRPSRAPGGRPTSGPSAGRAATSGPGRPWRTATDPTAAEAVRVGYRSVEDDPLRVVGVERGQCLWAVPADPA